MSDTAKSLLDLTEQGDPGTIDAPDAMQNFKLMDPLQLYRLWEKQQWASQDIDFTQDKLDWAAMSELERTMRLYPLSSFYLGEQLVTTSFAAYVMSAEDPNEEAFLATQLVDEARHTQFFDRFYTEVVNMDSPTIATRLAAMHERVNDSFHTLFSGHLQPAVEALVDNPKDRVTKVRAITIYHMVVEGTLALTGQYALSESYRQLGILPGFVAGFDHVSRDEHRHVAYGTWYLQRALIEDPAMEDVVLGALAETLPHTTGVLDPPAEFDRDEIDRLSVITVEQTHEYAFKALSRRMKAIGVNLDKLATTA